MIILSIRKRTEISIVLKFLVFAFMAAGMLGCTVVSDTFMGSPSIFLKYFTMQSNIWIGVLALVLAFVQLKHLKSEVYEFSRPLLLLQQVFTVSITLTGVVFCFVLLPAMLATTPEYAPYILHWTQILLHVIVPVLAVVDLLAFTRTFHYNLKRFDFLWSALPPLYYLGFSRIGYVKNWDFGGANYPYFFLNYDSPAGFFGFSNEMPYFMGVFYWILVIVVLVLGVSLLYTTVVNKRSIKLREQQI